MRIVPPKWYGNGSVYPTLLAKPTNKKGEYTDRGIIPQGARLVLGIALEEAVADSWKRQSLSSTLRGYRHEISNGRLLHFGVRAVLPAPVLQLKDWQIALLMIWWSLG